jgi:hypothetical protein
VIDDHVNSISSHTAIPRTLLNALRNVFEKNYRLQDIQLSKNRRRARAHRRGSARALRSLPKHGGEYRARTGDLLVANQALSQLS